MCIKLSFRNKSVRIPRNEKCAKLNRVRKYNENNHENNKESITENEKKWRVIVTEGICL